MFFFKSAITVKLKTMKHCFLIKMLFIKKNSIEKLSLFFLITLILFICCKQYTHKHKLKLKITNNK